MKTCLYCGYYKPADKGAEFGPCHALPPVVMLLPMPQDKATQIASGGRGMAMTLQTVRPTVAQGDMACRYFLPGKVE